MNTDSNLIFYVVVEIILLLMLLTMLRKRGVSMGLPFAYLAALLLQHAPGSYAHWARPELFGTNAEVSIGSLLTTVGAACFVLGVWLALPRSRGQIYTNTPTLNTEDPRFPFFCLLGGWLFIYGLSSLVRIPSLGAVIEKGGAIWMLGVILGLGAALRRQDKRSVLLWIVALAVYPTLMLLLSGFLSYGSAAAIIVGSALCVSTRSYPKVLVMLAALTFLGLSMFVNYFVARDALRSVIWSGAGFSERFDAVTAAFSNLDLFDINKDEHAIALDERLNQNYFAGLAADRLDHGEAAYVEGRSIYEGLISIIPRAIWPEKPVSAGSGSIVRDMTGLDLSETTSWGVGQVMEFYMNFGWVSLVIGFVFLGFVIARLDYGAALANSRGDQAKLITFFLPAAALIQPLGSLVELGSGTASAYVAAIGWRYAWREFARYRSTRARRWSDGRADHSVHPKTPIKQIR